MVVKNATAKAGDAKDSLDPWLEKIPWRRQRQHTSVFLGEFLGQRSLAGYSSWVAESDITEHTSYLALTDKIQESEMRPRKWSGLDTHTDTETFRARQGAGGRRPAEAPPRLPGRPTPAGEARSGARPRPRPSKTPEHRLSPQRRSRVRKRGLYFRASLKEGGAGWVLLAWGCRRDQLHRWRQVALTGELGAGLLGGGGAGVRPAGRGRGGSAC